MSYMNDESSPMSNFAGLCFKAVYMVACRVNMAGVKIPLLDF